MNNTKKILFIEDDQLIVKLFQTRLSAEGYEVLSAQDGDEGLEIFQKQKPDLIVLDLMLPKKSGVDVLKIIRKFDPKVPVLVYSNLSSSEKVDELISEGADKYFTKSDIHPRRFVEVIKSYLK